MFEFQLPIRQCQLEFINTPCLAHSKLSGDKLRLELWHLVTNRLRSGTAGNFHDMVKEQKTEPHEGSDSENGRPDLRNSEHEQSAQRQFR